MLVGMSLLHIPVRISATDSVESQAFLDVLGGQGGALALAAGDEKPLAMLVCPSGNTSDVGALPCVLLGDKHQNVPEDARILPIPARMNEILEALEEVASNRAGFTQARSY